MRNNNNLFVFLSCHSISTSFYKHLSQLCQNINLIIKARQQSMELVLNYKTTLDELNESDEEALDLFNNLNPEDSNPPPAEPEQMLNQSDEESMPHFHKLHKLKKGSKQDQKKQKKKNKKKHKKNKPHAHLMQDATPKKKLKKEGSSKKKRTAEQEGILSGDQGSSQFDSLSNKSEDLDMELKHLNPDASEDVSPKKRLRKSNKKSKIEEKQGFRIEQLGLDPEVDEDKLSVDSDDDDFSSEEKKRKQRKRKAKKPVISNAEMMNAFKEQGLVESEGQERQANYDNGLNMLHSMKDKKKNGIKINNRMFGDLDIDLRDEEVFMPPPENLQLELKPKSSVSSQRISFLSKAENIKKQRGLEADVDIVEYQRKASEKAKKSIAKVVSSMVSQQFHDQIDLEIRLPAVARGKSSDIINNTVFLKRFMSKNQNFEREEIPNSLPQSKSYSQSYNRKQPVSRRELFNQIKQQTRLRRSKYISDEQLKNSFKKTNLEELEEARKRIQQKKRKEALSEHDSDEENDQGLNNDSELNEMIRKEENLCGDGEENEEEDNQEKDSKEELNIQINIEELQQEEKDKNTPAKDQNEQNQENQENQPNSDQKSEQINEFNEVIDELASASQHALLRNQEEELIDQEEQQQEQQEQIEQQSISPVKQQPLDNGYIAPEMYMVNPQREKQLREMEDEGILMRKRRRVNKKEDPIEQEVPVETTTMKQNQINIPNSSSINKKESTKRPYLLQDDEDNIEQFNNFKKLRKIALVIAHKKKLREKGRKYAQQYIENEAQQGSDNEEHDDMIKNIDYDAEQKEYEGMDLDQDLVELIDNAVDINQEDEHEAFRKYLEDVRMQDRDEIKKIIRGEFKKKHEDLELEVEEDERKRKERMDEVMNWMKKREEDDGEGIYIKEPVEPEQDSNEDSEFGERRKEPVAEELEDSQQMPIEEQNAKLQKFLEDIVLTTTKREYKPTKLIDLGPLPESVKLEKSNSGRTISMSRFGGSSNEPKIATNKVKKTSSLINQILNKRTFPKFGHSVMPVSKSQKK